MSIGQFMPNIRTMMQGFAAIHSAHVMRFTGTAPTSASIWGGADKGTYPTGYTEQYAALPCYVFTPKPGPGQVVGQSEYYTQGMYEMRVFVDTVDGAPLDLTTNDIIDTITSIATGARLFEQSSPYQIMDITQKDAQTVLVLKAIAGKGTS